MRVAYVCADYGVPVFGAKGASFHVQELIRALRHWGAGVELFCGRVDGDAPSDLDDLTIHRLPEIPKSDQAQREEAALAGNQALYETLRREGPFDLVYERYSLWSFAGMQYSRDFGIPGLLEVNAPLIVEQSEYRGLVNRAVAEQVAARAFGDSRTIIAVSRGVQEYVERFPTARGRVHVVSNGVNAQRFLSSPQPSRPGPPGSFTVGFVGTMRPWHGLPNLVEAFAMLHKCEANSRLLVVGDGPERNRLLEDLSARGLMHAADVVGAIANAEIPGLLASMDVAVAPYPESAHFYFSPLKLYEYMAAGRAVVASRIGDLAELIEDGVNGLLCPPGDSCALADALGRLRRDLGLRTRLGVAARDTVLRNHTWDAAALRILSIAGLTAVIKKTRNPAVNVSDPFGITADPEMPFLAAAVDPHQALPQLEACLASWKQPEPMLGMRLRQIRVTRHKPGRRCLIEYDLEVERPGEPCELLQLIGKARARGSVESTCQLLRSLWNEGFAMGNDDGICVPEPVGLIPPFHMWLQRKVPGRRSLEFLTGPNGIELARRIAEAAHKIHRAGVPPNRSHTMADELRILHDRLLRVVHTKPEWENRIDRLLEACDQIGAATPQPRPRGIHRDFYFDQVLVDGPRLHLLDFDLYCQGDPALDVGNFLGHLIEWSLRTLGDPYALADRQAAIEERFVELAGPATRAAVHAYTVLTVARHIYLSTLFPERRPFTESLLELCEQSLGPLVSWNG